MTTVQYVAGTALSLVAFVMLANFIVFLYARGVVRAAVDEAARAGSRLDATESECQGRARDVLADLLGGALGDGVRISCADSGDVIRARASVTFRAWVPGLVPDWSFVLEAQSVKEQAP